MLGSIASSKASFLTPAAASGSRAGVPAGAPCSGMAEGLPAPQDCRRNNIDSRRGWWRAPAKLPLVDPARRRGSLTSKPVLGPAGQPQWRSRRRGEERAVNTHRATLQECYFTISTPPKSCDSHWYLFSVAFTLLYPLLPHILTDIRSRSPDSNWAAPFTL